VFVAVSGISAVLLEVDENRINQVASVANVIVNTVSRAAKDIVFKRDAYTEELVFQRSHIASVAGTIVREKARDGRE
jgi:hypothetical protein